ncbi:MAG: cell division protein FtsK [Bacteroidetes bacterium GWF2_42_66]|nr:MAG: cell division protein FtsK [Bacteroidetes bacterium GWA2_42_15]OFY01418.1 MAG: cell division protein FtsK [Bacteroidetes bacterium GWE2_42_39]OFY42259.1 MAG: cell division protein FtsK [Bacteroidetes bacterium GWF2_42_66]HBL77612.1 cell division protein FtsK [Prolixibacteraceae bacterium]HCB62742.1 cell division protein FtsK [Bacteroidales bacterium]
MAKKAAKADKPKKPSVFRKITGFFTGEKFRYTLGVFFLVFGVYLLVSFVSFLFSGDTDQSKMDISWGQLILDSEIKVENVAGKTGAFFGEVIINRGFGLSSFIFVFLIIATAFRLFGSKFINLPKAYAYSIILVVWISTTLGLLYTDSGAEQFLNYGGLYGFILSGWLGAMIGTIGAAMLLFLLLFLILVITFSGFIPWLSRLFTPKLKAEDALPLVNTVNTENKAGAIIELDDPVISKVITEDDIIEAIFDPDSDDEPEFEHNLSRRDILESIESQQKKTEEEEEPVGPELLVEKPVGEEDEEFAAEGMEEYDPTLDLSNYHFPTLELLDDHSSDNAEVSNEELISNKNKIVETLRHYKIEITKIRATIGPTITLYEIVPAPGIRIAKIKNLEDDIALSLSALGIRIIAPIPGRGTIGIEVPNQNPEVVSMRSIIGSKKFQESTADLPIALGKTISNETFMVDLTKMPHILVAGATGQGKSVGLNAIITSLLYKKHPSQLKFVLVDPKKVELNLYASLEKHFLAKMPDEEDAIITDIQKVKNTLSSINIEMDNRYDLLKKAHVRNIKEYNKKFTTRRLNPEKGHRYLPYIVVVVDEFADLIMTAGKEIELPIARIAQLARAVGIHMIIATQRPSINIITGVIKANFPARIAFKVASMIDSRTILDTPGANQLIGKGDMLITQGSSMTRVQCAFVDTPEVERICEYIAKQQAYPTAFLLPEFVGDESGVHDVDLNNKDEMFEDVARLIVANQMGSTSMIQRKFSIGYNRAGRIMDQLEVAGIVGPSEGSKARQVLIQDEYTLEQLLNSL